MAVDVKYHYPNHILESDYDNRRVTFYIKESKLSQTADKLVEKTKEIYNDAIQAGKEAIDLNTKYSESKRHLDKLSNASTITSIALPLPNTFIDTQTHDWDTEQSLLKQGIDRVDVLGVRNLADKALGQIQSTTGQRKPLIDPGYFQNYTGSQPRSFSFSFDFIPNNKEEAENIKSIIKIFKTYSLPSTVVSGTALLSPSMFDITIGNELMNDLIRMNSLVLTNIDVSFGAEGDMQLFYDGTPKMITMSLSFKERFTVTRDYY